MKGARAKNAQAEEVNREIADLERLIAAQEQKKEKGIKDQATWKKYELDGPKGDGDKAQFNPLLLRSWTMRGYDIFFAWHGKPTWPELSLREEHSERVVVEDKEVWEPSTNSMAIQFCFVRSFGSASNLS